MRAFPILIARSAKDAKRVTVAGIESRAPVFNDGKRSEDVVLQLKQITRIIEWERLPAQRHWLEN
jgi:hypothetical protein